MRRLALTTLAVSAAILAVVAASGRAQPPGARPGANPQPGYLQPGQVPTGYPSPGAAPGQQPNQKQGVLPLPRGYQPRTPPAQTPSATPPQPGAGPAPGSAGKIMYFHKPADALTVAGGSGASAGVAQLDGPGRAPVAVPDVPPVRPVAVPPPVSRPTAVPAPPPPPVAVPVEKADPVYVQQPEVKVEKKKEDYKIKPVDPKYIQLPPRDRVFMVYDDPELERVVVALVVDDLKKQDPMVKLDPETLRFPALPVIHPPGVPYQPKTAMYPPRQLLVEPGYVVHRRLHFEEKNSERTGWDLGPLGTLVSAGYFVRDVLLWPQSLASGCVTGFWDTNAGKCMPGGTSPYYLYPAGFTIPGVVFGGGIITLSALLILP